MSRVYHMDLETKKINCYILRDENQRLLNIYDLYIAGDELYAEINPKNVGVGYKLVRIITDKVEESNYYTDGYREFFLNVEEIKK